MYLPFSVVSTVVETPDQPTDTNFDHLIESLCSNTHYNQFKIHKLTFKSIFPKIDPSQDEKEEETITWAMFLVGNHCTSNVKFEHQEKMTKQYDYFGTVHAGSVTAVIVLPANRFEIFKPLDNNVAAPVPFHLVESFVHPGMPLGFWTKDKTVSSSSSNKTATVPAVVVSPSVQPSMTPK